MNKKEMKNRADTYFSDFSIKSNGGAHEVCMAPNIKKLENYFQRILQLDPGGKDFGTIT